MLQASPADVTNQLLLTNNKLLIANNELLVQGLSAVTSQIPFVPPPMFVPVELSPFQPSVAARWINCLFFVSLVLSLAAALVGILAKQWVREYIKWNSPLSVPRENVMVRQYRFEAWEDWNVATIISTVPALLEIAMIFFLTGVIILLWTLDDVVAKCVTAVASVAGFRFWTWSELWTSGPNRSSSSPSRSVQVVRWGVRFCVRIYGGFAGRCPNPFGREPIQLPD